jgi:DNA uptake protein ComE-like DNA-binding protein
MIRVLTLLLAGVCVAGAAWEHWENCQHLAEEYFDGDSFHIRHGQRDVIVRLYHADAPESDGTYPARRREQAAYFGVNETNVLRGGLKAKAFAAAWLAEPFTVITRRQVAPGASRSERYYAILERRGNRLDAALVAAGLARPNAAAADYPDAAAGTAFTTHLRSLERKAALEKRGLWAGSNRADMRQTFLESITPGPLRPALPAPRKLNINTASQSDLESLPGVGPALAEEIIKARPIRSLKQLGEIRGLGPKKLAALEPVVTFR